MSGIPICLYKQCQSSAKKKWLVKIFLISFPAIFVFSGDVRAGGKPYFLLGEFQCLPSGPQMTQDLQKDLSFVSYAFIHTFIWEFSCMFLYLANGSELNEVYTFYIFFLY